MSKPSEITEHECKPGNSNPSLMQHDTSAKSLHSAFILLLSAAGPVEIRSSQTHEGMHGQLTIHLLYFGIAWRGWARNPKLKCEVCHRVMGSP